jgi:hypothetical protein
VLPLGSTAANGSNLTVTGRSRDNWSLRLLRRMRYSRTRLKAELTGQSQNAISPQTPETGDQRTKHQHQIDRVDVWHTQRNCERLSRSAKRCFLASANQTISCQQSVAT